MTFQRRDIASKRRHKHITLHSVETQKTIVNDAQPLRKLYLYCCCILWFKIFWDFRIDWQTATGVPKALRSSKRWRLFTSRYGVTSQKAWILNKLTLRRLMSYISMEHPFLMFLDHTQRRSTVGRTPLDEWSARCRDLYMTTHDTHNRQISMPPAGFEPTIPAGKRPQTHALDRAATGTGSSDL